MFDKVLNTSLTYLDRKLYCNFIKKETLALMFSCEFCEISKNTFSYRTPPVAASAYGNAETYLGLIKF